MDGLKIKAGHTNLVKIWGGLCSVVNSARYDWRSRYATLCKCKSPSSRTSAKTEQRGENWEKPMPCNTRETLVDYDDDDSLFKKKKM